MKSITLTVADDSFLSQIIERELFAMDYRLLKLAQTSQKTAKDSFTALIETAIGGETKKYKVISRPLICKLPYDWDQFISTDDFDAADNRFVALVEKELPLGLISNAKTTTKQNNIARVLLLLSVGEDDAMYSEIYKKIAFAMDSIIEQGLDKVKASTLAQNTLREVQTIIPYME
jgi:hypothetical protein